jgi:Terpene synthase family 2, C-terminal metal binding
MKQQHVSVGVSSTLDRMRSQYADLLQSEPLSLERLFSPQDFQFNEFCKTFSAYPQSEKLIGIAEQFGRNHGVWQGHTRYYINCAALLYPNATADRMLTIMKNLTLGFYLNDVMGRDVFQFLSLEEQLSAEKMISRMAGLDADLELAEGASAIEEANAIVLGEFRAQSTKEWFWRFQRLYTHHVDITHRDGNTWAEGSVPDVFEYIERRCHTAGMNHIVLWVEFSDGQFLEWALLKEVGLAQKMERLHWLTAAFGALSNDLFSFEKEVVDRDSDSNLVAIISLNDPRVPLKEAIFQASEIVQNYVLELMSLLEVLKGEMRKLDQTNPVFAGRLTAHVRGIVRFVQASWLWQLHAGRYKRSSSIWVETTLGSKVAG